MACKYCKLCDRPVEPKRQIGIGTLILVFITALVWVIFIPFYSKRCPICGSTKLISIRKAEKLKKKAAH